MQHSFQVRAVPAPGEAGRMVSIDASDLPVLLEEEICISVRRRMIEAMMIQELSKVLSPAGGAVAAVGLSMIPANGVERSIAPIAAGIGTVIVGLLGNLVTVRHLKHYANNHPWETAVTFHEASDSFEHGSGDSGDVRIQRFRMFLDSVRPGVRQAIGWLFARFTKSSETRQLLTDLHTTCQTWCVPLRESEDYLKMIARGKIIEEEQRRRRRARKNRASFQRLREENTEQTGKITSLTCDVAKLKEQNEALQMGNARLAEMVEMILERNRQLECTSVGGGNGEVQ